jgi:hypothetical protein
MADRYMLAVCCLALAPASGFAAEPSGASNTDAARTRPEPAAIDTLIHQLGSTRFNERDAATRSLNVIAAPALDALREAAAHGPDLEVRRRAADLVRVIENRPDALLLDYRAYGLLLPPPNAPLVRTMIEYRDIVNGKPGPRRSFVRIGFLLPPDADWKTSSLLYGTWRERRTDEHVTVLNPGRATARDIQDWLRDVNLSAGLWDGLVLAVQCEARGWHALARAILDRFRPTDAGVTPRAGFTNMAWKYLTDSLCSPRSDWALLARRLKRLMARAETLNTRPNRELIRSLDAALVPSKAKPGTIAAMIDDLIQAGAEEYLDARAMRLLLRGFDAVPELIEHLDDDRLTHGMAGGLRGPWRHERVHDFVNHVLGRIAGGALGGLWLDIDSPDPPITKAQARAWWKKAKQTGEEAYLLAHVGPGDDATGGFNTFLLAILGKKHPKALAGLYLDVVDKRPGVDSTDLAQAIAESALPPARKLELLLHVVRGTNIRHRVSALGALKDLDAHMFAQLLVQSLEALPQKAKGPYWSRPEISHAYLVAETADPRPWRALLNVARRSPVEVRLEILNGVGGSPGDNKQHGERLHFLAAFLDDTAVRERAFNPNSLDGPRAAPEFERMAVRDLAAIEIAYILELPAEPTPEWSAEQWTKLRAEVRQALDRQAKSGPRK